MEKKEEELAPTSKVWTERQTPSLILPGRNNYVITPSQRENLNVALARDIVHFLRKKKEHIFIFGDGGIKILEIANGLLLKEEIVKTSERQIFTTHGIANVFNRVTQPHLLITASVYGYAIFLETPSGNYEKELLIPLHKKGTDIMLITQGENESEEHIL